MEANDINSTPYAAAQQAMSHARNVGYANEERAMGGLYIPTKTTAPRPTFTLGDVIVTKVVKIEYESGIASHEVHAAKDADTGVILLTIGCQSHPIQRWERIAARLIRRHYEGYSGETVVELERALDQIIAAAENALAD